MTKGRAGLTFLGKSELELGRNRVFGTGRYFMLAFISLFLSPVKYAGLIPVSGSFNGTSRFQFSFGQNRQFLMAPCYSRWIGGNRKKFELAGAPRTLISDNLSSLKSIIYRKSTIFFIYYFCGMEPVGKGTGSV